jgi:hypothetical protein
MVRLGRRAALAALGLGLAIPTRAWAGADAWVVSPAEAGALIAVGALVLDARADRLRRSDRVPGAVAPVHRAGGAAHGAAPGR